MARLRILPASALSVSLLAHGTAIVAMVHTPPRVEPPPVRVESAPPLAGDTFEAPSEEPVADETANSPDNAAPSASPGGARAGETVHAVAANARRASRSTSHAEPAAPATPEFGALGDRSAVEVVGALTHAFPQAASADPEWASAPFGAAGAIDLALTLDESGSLVSVTTSGAPSPALREGVKRALALIRGRSFVSYGAVTRVRISARVSPDTVHDGLHGDVFALGGSMDGVDGRGFFALSVGRRIDVVVKRLR